MLKPFLLACLALTAASSPGWAASVFTSRPDDPAAVYVDAPGASDSDHSALLQAALDRAGTNPNGGIVFVPSGRYRITRTLIVWRAVRVVGYGDTRPVLVLPERTPGYQEGVGLMVLFTSTRPNGGDVTTRAPFSPPGIVPRADHIPDANQGTFYSSMMNVDVEIGDGNPAAVAVRFHVAQHGVLSHMDFRTGSGLAAIMEVGNVGQNLRFFGGRYGILTTNTSPFWPYTLIDSLFDGQREAAIREHLAGLTVIRTTFRNVPVGISIDRDYSDQLWLKDAR
ncbi:MAG TPA: glycosyl hydrolase family 28-related protein, partial [Vicinamibacterales bacterium]|nr:glycosyl hydrolase family 28-related protein [Vicinamibacterales bacterium]